MRKRWLGFIVIICVIVAVLPAHAKKAGALKSAEKAIDATTKGLDQATDDLNKAIEAQNAEVDEIDGNLNDQGVENVMIRLLYPLGKSPKVFTKGWVFGAQAMYMPKEKMNDDDADPINLSDKIEWSGSGSFKPKIGKKSRPSFNGPGTNTIVLTVEADGKKVTKTVKVEAVSPAGYATVGATATAKCAHGCPACPHDVKGVFAGGSSAVLIDGKPALRVGDGGKHTVPCCGPNTFKVVEGDPSVVINGKQAVKYGAKTQHCGGVGTVTRN